MIVKSMEYSAELYSSSGIGVLERIKKKIKNIETYFNFLRQLFDF